MAIDPLVDPNSNEYKIIDPFNGLRDLRRGILRFVGKPEDRIREDGLRVLRALRFEITKNLSPKDETFLATRSHLVARCSGDSECWGNGH